MWFRRGRFGEFAELKERIEQMILAAREASLGFRVGVGWSVADEIHKLVDLRNRGAITEAEFQVQRIRILDE